MKRLLIVLFFAPAISVLSGCGKEQVSTQQSSIQIGAAQKERPVLTLVVGTSTSGEGAIFSGEIRARHETQMGFRLAGKIIERLVDPGARVKAGQVLARLDPADASLQMSSAQAQYQLAVEDMRRYRELRSKNFVSQSALDAKEAALKAIAAQAGLAGNQAAYTTLRADHDGIVAATLAEAGQVVAAGQPVIRLAQEGEREVAIAVPEAQFPAMKIGMKAEVSLWSAADEATRFSGQLRELSPVADPVSRTYAARVALDGAEAAALGMTAQVRFAGRDKRDVLIVPLTAIFQQGAQPAVWVVGADRSISLRPVQVAAYRDIGAVISGGLKPGERIVSAGVHKLTAGEKVRTLEGEFADGSVQ